MAKAWAAALYQARPLDFYPFRFRLDTRQGIVVFMWYTDHEVIFVKTDRLIGIVTLLLQKGRMTAPELAKRFEVSRRTINRDIEALCKAGIPICTTQGCGGGISIAEGYQIDSTFFTEEELQNVLTGLKGLSSVSRAPELRYLFEKLNIAGTEATDDTMVIDLASFYQAELTEKIETIKRAIRSQHRLTFLYYAAGGESRREVEPCRVVFQWSSWYLLGYCLSRKAFRLFKLNRLWELRDTGERFSPRELPAEALDFKNRFAAANYRLRAVFEQSQAYRLIDEYGVGCFSARQDGRLLFERDFTNYDSMLWWVLSFGDKAVVLAPEELKRDILAQAKNILNKSIEHDK